MRQEASGFVAASQRASAEARGRFLAAMGADDIARPRRLELQLAALEGDGLAACGGGVTYIPHASDGLRRYERWLNSLTTVEAAWRDLFVECRTTTARATASRSAPSQANRRVRALREFAREQGRRELDDFVAVA